MLIGADGLWSRVREQVVGDGPPRVTGHTTYRSVIPTERMPEDLRWNAATLWAGPKCHIVHYPLSGWKVFNLVVTYHNDAPEPVAGKPVDEEEVMSGFRHVHPARPGHHPPRHRLEALGAVRPRPGGALGGRARGAARRRRAPDLAVPRARRLHGDGGRGLPRARDGGPPRGAGSGAGGLPPPPRAAHRAGATPVARRRRAHLPPRRRARPAAQRGDVGQEPGGVARHPRLALWRHRPRKRGRGCRAASRGTASALPS